MTKQYLSECTTWVDYFIFAMAPLCLVTAIVSVIRVCGDSSLRAFIGRAQEGDGVVEAELCTSTSRDVCELFNKGGITRVLDPKNETAGLFLFRDYVSRLESDDEEWKLKGNFSGPHQAPDMRPSLWSLRGFRFIKPKTSGSEVPPTSAADPENANTASTTSPKPQKPVKAAFYLPSPNISLNVGIVKRPPWVFYAVALLGFSVQAGVVVLAVVLSWTLEWGKDGAPTTLVSLEEMLRDNNAPLTFLIGTVFMCLGTFCCAAMIGQSTREQVYKRRKPSVKTSNPVASEPDEKQKNLEPRQQSQLFWLQPGNQLVGDETYDAFAYAEDKERLMQEYITSVKVATPREHIYTWLVIVITLGGYIAQFVGLRGMHAYVSLAQLGIIVIMGFLRRSLRMQRLTRSANNLGLILDKVTGHELDWLALELCKDDTGSSGDSEYEDRDQGSQQSGPGATHSSANTESRLSWYPSGKVQSSLASDPKPPSQDGTLLAKKFLQYRTRLAQLTGHGATFGAFQDWKDNQVLVRVQARRVARAICQVAEIVLGDNYTKDITLSFETVMSMGNRSTHKADIDLVLHAPNPAARQGWYVDSSVLEGLLGLWVWSLKYAKDFDKYDDESDGTVIAESIGKARIVSANLTSDILGSHGFLDLWLGENQSQIYEAVLVPGSQALCNSMTLWGTGSIGSGPPLDDAELPTDRFNGADHWIPTTVPTDATPSTKESLQDTTTRFFGWNRVKVWPTQPGQHLHVYYAKSKQSLSTECGLELFSYAIQALSQEGRTLIRPENNTNEETTWSNSKITSFCLGLLESGMSDYGSALLCVISGLESLLSIPGDDFDILDVISAASQYRKMKQWRRAERILQWACGYYSVDSEQSTDDSGTKNPISVAYRFAGMGRKRSLRMAVIALGEIYRWALLDSDSPTSSWGSQGFDMMIKHLPTVITDHKTSLIIERYGAVRWFLAKARNESTSLPADLGPYRDLISSEMGQLHDTSEFVQLLYEFGQERMEGSFKGGHFENEDHDGDEADIQPATAATFDRPQHFQDAVNLGNSTEVSDDDRNSWFRKAQRSRTAALIRLSFLGSGNTTALKTIRGIAAHTGWFEILLAIIEIEDGTSSNRNKENGIYSSIQLDDVVAARILLLSSGKPDQPIKDIGTLVAKAGSLGILGLLLDNDIIGPFWTDAKGRTILSLAAEGGKVHLVDFLLSLKEVDPDSADTTGRTPLSHAAMNGHFPVVNLLVTTGMANPDSRDHMGQSPLILALLHGADDDTIRLLIAEARVNKNLQSSNGDTPLMLAARQGRLSALMALADLPSGTVDTSVRDSLGRTPFLLTVVNGHLDCARLLVERLRAGPNVHDGQGRTALSIPVSRARRGDLPDFAIVQYLLNLDSLDLNARDRKGDTALHKVFAELEDEDNYASGILRRLLRAPGLDRNKRNLQGRTALHEFIRSSRPDLEPHVQTFLEHPMVDPTIRDRQGETLLHSAAAVGSEYLFELLLDDGRIDPDTPGVFGATALHAAIFARFNTSLSRMLADQRGDPSKLNEQGDTALHIAVKINNGEAVKMLIRSTNPGTRNINLRNKMGHTPLQSTIHFLGVDTLITEYLLEGEDVDINAEDDLGRTVIWATATSFPQFVGEFVSDAREDDIAANISDYLDFRENYEEVQRKVRLVWSDFRVEKNHQDRAGRTVLHAAAISGEGIELIIAYGVDPDIQDKQGARAIDLARTEEVAERIRNVTATESNNANPDNSGENNIITEKVSEVR